MFAYCGNNPVIYVDGSGTSPFSRNLDLFDYYTIHKIVQLLCVADEGWDMEVYVKGPKGRGFLDLYDTDSNSYYEVKSSGAANKASTTTQMDKYDVALIKAKRYSKDNIISSPTRGTEMVQGSFVYGMWDIDYSIRSPGLIVYTAEYNEQRALGTAVALVIIYCVMTGNIPSAIGLAPALGCA